MPRVITSISVFLASPSDVDHERGVVTAAVDEWNSRHGRDRSVLFNLIKWENISAGFGTDGQDVINTQLSDDYDVLVAVFWAKLGTPTPRAESGSVEEYERALKRFRSGENVELAFFFKDTPIDFRALNLDQVAAVKSFEVNVQKAGALTKSFRDDDGLKLEIGLLLDRLARQVGKPILTETSPVKDLVTAPSADSIRQADEGAIGDDSNDIGLFDAIENLELHAEIATGFLTGLGECLDSLSGTTSAVNQEYEDIKRMRPLEPSDMKPRIQRIAMSMDEFSIFLESELPTYAENVAASANDIRDMIQVSYDYIETSTDVSETLHTFTGQLMTMDSQMAGASSSTREMLDTIVKLQRTTSQFNKSRRRLVRNLNGFVDATENGRALVKQALTEIGELTKQATSSGAVGPSLLEN